MVSLIENKIYDESLKKYLDIKIENIPPSITHKSKIINFEGRKFQIFYIHCGKPYQVIEITGD